MDATNAPDKEMNSSKALLELDGANSTPVLALTRCIIVTYFCQKVIDAFMKRLLPNSIDGTEIDGYSSIGVCATMLGISEADVISIIGTESWFNKDLMLQVGYKRDENAEEDDVNMVGHELKKWHHRACVQAQQYLKYISGVDIFCNNTSSRSRREYIHML